MTVETIQQSPGRTQGTVRLLERLLSSLEENGVRYCHWKSNTAIRQILSGDTDLDLLVARDCEETFREIIRALGFVEAVSATSRWYPYIEHHYAYDPDSGRILHIHLHLLLVVGHDLLKDYHLPVEDAYLGSTRHWHRLRVPQPEFEFIVFVIRMVLKRRLLPAVIAHPIVALKAIVHRRLPPLSCADAVDMQRLQAASCGPEIARLLDRHFPGLSLDGIESLAGALKGDLSDRSWQPAWKQLCHAVRPYRRHGPLRTVALAVYRRLFLAFCMVATRLHVGHPLKKRLRQGCIFALVGGDGAGKTTNIAELKSWLERFVAVASLHVGRPPKGAPWYLAMFPLRLLRVLRIVPERFYLSVSYLLIARYRYLVCRKARRLRRRGTIVLLDRVPLSEIRTMDCPRIRELTGVRGAYGLMARLEERYYVRMQCADGVAVLKLDPRIARERRPDDDQQMLNARSGEIWDATWTSSGIHIVDASQPVAEVQRRLRIALWECAVKPFVIGELIGVAGSGKSTIASRLAAGALDVAGRLSWRQNIPMCVRVLGYRLPQVAYQIGRGVPLRFLAIMVNIEVTLRLLTRHRESRMLGCGRVVLDLGPFLQLATLRHAYLAQAPTLASSTWLSELTAQARQVIDRVFWLDADDRVLMERVSERAQVHAMKGRPAGAFERFFSEYRREFADLLAGYPSNRVVRIDTGVMSADHVCELIDAHL